MFLAGLGAAPTSLLLRRLSGPAETGDETGDETRVVSPGEDVTLDAGTEYELVLVPEGAVPHHGGSTPSSGRDTGGDHRRDAGHDPTGGGADAGGAGFDVGGAGNDVGGAGSVHAAGDAGTAAMWRSPFSDPDLEAVRVAWRLPMGGVEVGAEGVEVGVEVEGFEFVSATTSAHR
ncbi:hypothetical protein T484DRAFT_1803148, partial [Baffinella frigidus]